MIKRIKFTTLLCIFTGLAMPFVSFAQTSADNNAAEEDSVNAVIAAYNAQKTDPATMDFHFVYIDHEAPPATPSAQLCTRIDKLRRDAAETGNPLIIYMANDEKPYLSFTNLTDPNPSLHRDSIEAFHDIIDVMQSVPSHEVDRETDLKNLTRLIGISGSYPLFDERGNEGTMRFKSVTIDFYIGPRFWRLKHNERLIGQLFTILNLSKYMNMYPRKKLSFNVFKAGNVELEYPEGKPFGDNGDINIINEKLSLFKQY